MTGMEFGLYCWFILPITGLVIVTENTEMTGDGIGPNTVTQLVTVTEMTWMEVGPYYWFILPVTG